VVTITHRPHTEQSAGNHAHDRSNDSAVRLCADPSRRWFIINKLRSAFIRIVRDFVGLPESRYLRLGQKLANIEQNPLAEAERGAAIYPGGKFATGAAG
jgi:hypothetical protein